MKIFLPVAGFFGFVGILMAALGSHYFSQIMIEKNYQDYQLALRYELLHSVTLMMIGLFGFLTRKPFRLLQLSAYLMVVGVIFFCGSIYLLTIYSARDLVYLIPVGGTAFLLAWIIVCIAGIYYYFHAVHAHDL